MFKCQRCGVNIFLDICRRLPNKLGNVLELFQKRFVRYGHVAETFLQRSNEPAEVLLKSFLETFLEPAGVLLKRFLEISLGNISRKCL